MSLTLRHGQRLEIGKSQIKEQKLGRGEHYKEFYLLEYFALNQP
jgi:hypothetical protein